MQVILKIVCTSVVFLFCLESAAQNNAVVVAESTIKISGMHEEIFYYGFAEGDQIIFSFQEMNNKKLKELEILEYPSNSKFMDFRTRKIEAKAIPVLRTGVYAFRLSNNNLLSRICKVKIERIPATDQTKKFNTSVKWVDRPDTNWNVFNKDVVVGYDTLFTYKTKKVIVKTEITEDFFMTRDERVNSQMNSNGNRASVLVNVPSYPSSEFIKKKVISLSYWVGVGEEANAQWEKNIKLIKGLAKGIAGMYTSPLGAYAVGAVTDLALPSIGEIVNYAIVDEQNKTFFEVGMAYRCYEKGRGVAGFNKITNRFLLRDTWYIVLLNENYVQGINVSVKASVIVQTDYYEEKPYTEQIINARYESKVFKEPIVKMIREPLLMK